MTGKKRNRSRNITPDTLVEILGILDGWNIKRITWDLLIDQIFNRIGVRYTRQTLNNHAQLKIAFSARKLINSRSDNATKILSQDQQRIARLESENTRLKTEINNLLEQFNRWVYNGFTLQMDERMRASMNNPLPTIYRGASNVD